MWVELTKSNGQKETVNLWHVERCMPCSHSGTVLIMGGVEHPYREPYSDVWRLYRRHWKQLIQDKGKDKDKENER